MATRQSRRLRGDPPEISPSFTCFVCRDRIYLRQYSPTTTLLQQLRSSTMPKTMDRSTNHLWFMPSTSCLCRNHCQHLTFTCDIYDTITNHRTIGTLTGVGWITKPHRRSKCYAPLVLAKTNTIRDVFPFFLSSVLIKNYARYTIILSRSPPSYKTPLLSSWDDITFNILLLA